MQESKLMKHIVSFLIMFNFLSCYATTEKPIVIIIPSYNNEQWCIENISSALNQEYQNFRIIFIDDCSTDLTFEKVQACVNAHPRKAIVTLIHNTQRVGALENLYNAIHSCHDYEVVATLDGDDWITHLNVLQRINQAYQNADVWLTYGQFVFYPSGQPGYCKEIPASVINSNGFRSHPWLTSHMRTFYAGLFKKITKEDLQLQGKFYPVTWDQAMLLPMLEMAGNHTHFIPDTLYVYNCNNPLNDEKLAPTFVVQCERQIRQKPSYKRLDNLILHGPDLIIFSYDRPLQLYALLESIECNMKDINSIQIIYRTSQEKFEHAYQEVKKRFAHVIFKKQTNPPHDFKTLVLESVYNSQSPYVLFAVDDIIAKESVNLKECIEKMEKYKTYGSYLRMGVHLDFCYSMRKAQPIPAHQMVDEHYMVWCFDHGQSDWKYPHTVDMTIYRKTEIEPYLRNLSYHSPNTLESEWAAKGHAVFSRHGICCASSKILNIPLNVVDNHWGNRHMNWKSTDELLALFNQGLKIDIQPLQHLKNKSAHIHYEPHFVART